MGVRAVVFDIGGVLEITPDLGTDDNWRNRLGLSQDEWTARTRPIWRGGSLGKLTLDQVHAGLGAALQIDAATVGELMDDIWVEYLGTLNTVMVEYLRALRPTYRTAILSNSFVGAREREAAAYGFPDLVDFVVYSHEVGFAKPDPRVYELTCERLGVPAPEVVFLDDAPACVEGARDYGIQAVLFQDNAQAIGDLDALLGRAGDSTVDGG